ncbi:MAG: phenylacetate-CoA oxygenase subunit PaaC [Bacteroidota bacterium]|nr:phenylacetate-CoA oxygenase subunit PaaC [Bacteroidota bacterium]
MKVDAIKDLLFKIADDQLILGHRNSEWTGIGPILEEDIAFSSMAQDKIGQSLAFYSELHNLGEAEPDPLAFLRPAAHFKNCHFVELPIGEYDFSLIRHFLFDHAELIRFELLGVSSYDPLALISNKIRGEIKYHVMHADVWIKKLGTASEESIQRLQAALEQSMPYAMGIFEESRYETLLKDEGVFVGEAILKERWLESINNVLNKTSLNLPDTSKIIPETGGRFGKHTPHLHDLLAEMGEVFRLDPEAEW